MLVPKVSNTLRATPVPPRRTPRPSAPKPAKPRERETPFVHSTPGAVTLDGPVTQLMKGKDLAEYLNVSGKTLLRAVRAGKIPFVRIGESHRFDIRAVRAALAGKKPDES